MAGKTPKNNYILSSFLVLVIFIESLILFGAFDESSLNTFVLDGDFAFSSQCGKIQDFGTLRFKNGKILEKVPKSLDFLFKDNGLIDKGEYNYLGKRHICKGVSLANRPGVSYDCLVNGRYSCSVLIF